MNLTGFDKDEFAMNKKHRGDRPKTRQNHRRSLSLGEFITVATLAMLLLLLLVPWVSRIQSGHIVEGANAYEPGNYYQK
jgi:hypothetical protein